MEKNLQAPQVLLSANVMKSPVLPVLKVELAGFWDTLNLNNMPQKSESSFAFFVFCLWNFDHSFLPNLKSKC